MSLNTELLYCPITRQLFNKPVIASDGITYEKNAIKKWLRTNVNSPISRIELKNELFDNRLIRNIINDLLK